MNAADEFRRAIEAASLTPPADIQPGKWIKFPGYQKGAKNRAGWCFMFDDMRGGQFGDYSTGMEANWQLHNAVPYTNAEREANRQHFAAVKAQREAEAVQRHESAAVQAAQRLAAAAPCTEHAYTTIKGVQCHGLRVDAAGGLIVPMIDTTGKTYSLQTITPDGDKRFLSGGRVKGCYHPIGKPAGLLIVCEGYATGASIHESTNHVVAVAFNAGNLEAVATALHSKYPALKIIIAADDDYLTEGNPGMTKAKAAAQAVGGLVAMPSFPAGRGDKDTDFNDLHQLAGASAVKACIEEATLSNTAGTGGLHGKQETDEEIVDLHRNAPRPDPACLYGLIGDIARAGSRDTEANPYAIAAAALAYLGAAVGRGPYMAVGDDWHHANLFVLHVGRSARGRKGTAKKLVLRLAKAIKEKNEYLAPQIHRGGLSSREGLALLIHDGWTEGKTEVPAIEDKRLLVVESEFANILHQSLRSGNTLSPALRDSWDGVSIKPATKTSRVWASNPHIAMIADVTPSELLELMHSRELSNGFANRFIVFWAEGEKVNPFPKPTAQAVIDELALRVTEVLRFAGADRHVDRDILRVELSQEAATLYARLYRGELRDRSAGERVAGLLDRRAPTLLRMAMLFALTDQSTSVEAVHINAALAWVRYWADSVKFIFQSAMDEAGAADVSDTGEKITAYLHSHGQASRSELIKRCFAGHVSKDRINRALDELLTANPAVIVVETIPRPKGVSGTPTKIYKTSANCAKSANYGEAIEHPADLDSLRTVRCMRTVGGLDEIYNLNAEEQSPQFAIVRTVRHEVKTAEILMDSHSSHISQTSQPSQPHSENEVPADDVEVF